MICIFSKSQKHNLSASTLGKIDLKEHTNVNIIQQYVFLEKDVLFNRICFNLKIFNNDNILSKIFQKGGKIGIVYHLKYIVFNSLCITKYYNLHRLNDY